jgi:hypothetical protein
MKTIVGSKMQEEKISEMGTTANEMFPHIETIVFKGSFRRGIRSALEKCGVQTWEEVAADHPVKRRKFFQHVLNESHPHLTATGLNGEETDALLDRLKKENEKYLTL